MGFLDKLSRIVTGGGAAQEATEALRQCCIGSVQRARQLRRHADLAPQAYSHEGLADLAAAEEKQAERLRETLQSTGTAIPAVPADPSAPGALNHWRRLVHDLEAHRLSARRLRELAVHFAETLPATAQLFDALCREETTHCERLRTLIARADPQALD
jgi:hypothetical protein